MKALSTHAANTCSSGHEGNTTFYPLWPETLLKQYFNYTQKILKTQKLYNYTFFTATQLPPQPTLGHCREDTNPVLSLHFGFMLDLKVTKSLVKKLDRKAQPSTQWYLSRQSSDTNEAL